MRLIPQLFGALAIGLLGYWQGTRHASATRETQIVTVQRASPTPKPGTKGTNGQTAGYHPGIAAELLAALEATSADDELNRMLVLKVAALQGDERRMMAEEMLEMPEETQHVDLVLYEIINQWAADEAIVVLAWLEALPESLPQLENQFNTMTGMIARKLAKSDGAKALQVLHKIEDNSMNLTVVFGNWFAYDPSAAVAALANLPESEQDTARRGISKELGKMGPAGAMNAIKNLPPKLHAQAQIGVLEDWVGSDTVAAMAWLQSISHEDQLLLNATQEGLGHAISDAAEADPSLVLKLAESLEPSLRSGTLKDIAASWASKDFDAAWKWAQSLTSPRERTDALAMMGKSAADHSIETIMKLAGEITGDAGTQKFLDRCCKELSHGEPAKFADLLRQLSPAQLRDLKDKPELFSNIGSDHPEIIIQLLMDIPSLSDGKNIDRDWEILMKDYSRTDPQAAYEFALSQPNAATLISEPLVMICYKNPTDALSKAQQLTDEKLRRDMTSKLFKQWHESDASGMERALPTMSGELRKLGLEVAIRRKSQDAPAATAAYLQQLQTSTREEDRQAANNPAVLQQLGSSWGEREPDAAINWIPKVPAGELREEFIQYLARSWTSQDTTKASQWVAGLPAGREKDAAVIGMLGTIGGSDPEAAFAWAAQIGNAEKKEDGYSEIIQSLHNKSPEAAKSALETAPISEKRKAELREALK